MIANFRMMGWGGYVNKQGNCCFFEINYKTICYIPNRDG